MPSETETRTKPPRDIDSLRIALRLCLDAERADRVAALAGTAAKVEVASLPPVMRVGRACLLADRVVGLRESRGADQPLLRLRRGVSPIAALSLALHLGLGLSAGELALLTHRTLERAGRDLMVARQAFVGDTTRPCDAFASTIGRYRDARQDRDETLSLMSHVSTCERCRIVFERAREFDERALGHMLGLRARITPEAIRTGWPESFIARPAAFWGAVAVLLLVLTTGGIVAAGRVQHPARAPASLLASAANPSAIPGWLLETTSTGEVDALNVATGAWRVLVPGQPSGATQSLISPDRKQVALVTTSQPSGRPDRLRIFTLSGSLVNDWPLAGSNNVMLPLAWYGDASLLLCRIPAEAFGASSEIRAAQADQQGALILFNVSTGQQRTIFDHAVRSVVPSPDGRYIAVGRYATNSGRTIEIRAFDGKEMGPVRTTMDDFGLPFSWMPNSKRVLFTRIQPVDATPVPRNLGDRGLSGQPAFTYAIATQDVDGHVESLLTIPRGETGHVAGVSPDGSRMVYLLQSNTPSGTDWAFWWRDLQGGEPVRVASAVPGVGGESVAWSPTGAAFITVAEPFFLSISSVVPLTAGPTSFVTTMVSPDGHLVTVLRDQLRAPIIAGFVTGTLPAPESDASSNSGGSFSPAQVVPGVTGTLSLVEGSEISSGGGQVLAYDRARGLYAGIATSGDHVASVAGEGDDPAWLPDGSGIISVLADNLGQSTGSRITVYDSGAGLARGPLEFDPADLDHAANARYRLPQLAPDGTACSFFVVDGGRADLWIAGRHRSPQSIVSWSTPSGAQVDEPLVARWVDRDTLVFAAVDDWVGGYPRRVDLQRARLQPDGTVRIDLLVTWSVHANERGLSITAMSVSPEGSKLAVRVRHFTGNRAADAVDSIEVMRATDLSRSLELVRGPSARGMSWSPDGNDLAVAIGSRIAVTSWTGDELANLPVGSGPAELPAWVRRDEIWFDAGSSGAPSILRVVR